MDYDKANHQFSFGGLDDAGALIMSAMVWMANIKILISSNSHTFWSFFWIFGSIGWFYLFEWVLSRPELMPYDPVMTGIFFMQ